MVGRRIASPSLVCSYSWPVLAVLSCAAVRCLGTYPPEAQSPRQTAIDVGGPVDTRPCDVTVSGGSPPDTDQQMTVTLADIPSGGSAGLPQTTRRR